MKIWKFPLQLTDIQLVSMPVGAQILSVANQDGNLCLWALVDPTYELSVRYIEVIGTGNPMDEGERKFIGTAVINPFVWHVFERID